MKRILAGFKYSGVIAMLFAASCGVGAAPSVSNAGPASSVTPAKPATSPGMTTPVAPGSARVPQANTTRTPTSGIKRPPLARIPSLAPPPALPSDPMQQRRQQSGEQMILERKGRAADTN